MPIKIIAPKDHQKPKVRTYRGIFVACGRAHHEVLGISGNGHPTAHPAAEFPGETLRFCHHLRAPGAGDKFRWVVRFKVPKNDEYTIEIKGRSAAGAGPSASCTFATEDVVKRPSPAPDGTVKILIGITWPPDDPSDITDQKDDFTPYGDLPDAPLASVSLQPADATWHPTADPPIIPPFSYGDYTSLFYWTAQFDPLGAGNYILTARDSNGASQSSRVFVT